MSKEMLRKESLLQAPIVKLYDKGIDVFQNTIWRRLTEENLISRTLKQNVF